MVLRCGIEVACGIESETGKAGATGPFVLNYSLVTSSTLRNLGKNVDQHFPPNVCQQRAVRREFLTQASPMS